MSYSLGWWEHPQADEEDVICVAEEHTQLESTTQRFEKAEAKLEKWREVRKDLERGKDTPPSNIMDAVDAAFKSEVLECRIREALNCQAQREARVSGCKAHETHTGKHLWDFDWWLTEATLRRLHSGTDAVAQLLNVVFQLGMSEKQVSFRALAEDAKAALKNGKEDNSSHSVSVLREKQKVADAVGEMDKLPAYEAVNAFVNHVKHTGFPGRHVEPLAPGYARATSIGPFCYKSGAYGCWDAQHINTFIDEFRDKLLAILTAALEAVKAGGGFRGPDDAPLADPHTGATGSQSPMTTDPA